jgi:hypothetical protein
MNTHQTFLLVLFGFFPALSYADMSRSTAHFQHWYGESNQLAQIIEANCSTQYKYYLGETGTFFH